MMVLGSWEPLELGITVEPTGGRYVFDAQGNSHQLPFIPVKPATFEDWLACLVEMGGDPDRPRQPYRYFYFVLMD